MISFYCSCGFRYEGNDVDGANHEPLPGCCCNCGGQRCMDCVTRNWHDQCQDTCPDCCAA